MTPTDSAEKVVAELRERTAFRFAGDCKCGKCQLVPRELVDRAIAALTAAEAGKKRYRAALERIARWEKHGGEKPRVYPVDIARAALSEKGA